MDKKLFEQKLSEVAEWRLPKTITGTKDGDAKRPRGRPSKEEQYQIDHEEEFKKIFGDTNPTFPPQLLKLKNSACVCEDCGKVCENGRQKEKKLYETGGKKNWRERCLTCDLSKNPFTGKYDMDHVTAGRAWIDFLRETKGLYKTKRNEQREDQGIITIHPDSKRGE